MEHRHLNTEHCGGPRVGLLYLGHWADRERERERAHADRTEREMGLTQCSLSLSLALCFLPDLSLNPQSTWWNQMRSQDSTFSENKLQHWQDFADLLVLVCVWRFSAGHTYCINIPSFVMS